MKTKLFSSLIPLRALQGPQKVLFSPNANKDFFSLAFSFSKLGKTLSSHLSRGQFPPFKLKEAEVPFSGYSSYPNCKATPKGGTHLLLGCPLAPCSSSG